MNSQNFYEEFYKNLYPSKDKQPELFDLIIDPINIQFVYNKIQEQFLNKKLKDIDFLQYSIEFLSIQLRDPPTHYINNIGDLLSEYNHKWVDYFIILFKSNNFGSRDFYLHSANTSFIPQIQYQEQPIVTNKTKFLIYDQGLGDQFTNGKLESTRLNKQFDEYYDTQYNNTTETKEI